jgi:hypothetical protein
MANAKVIPLFPHLPDKMPKGTAWLVFHRRWLGGGSRTAWAFVYNFEAGLTAYEAWQATSLPGNPPYYETVVIQLAPYPAPTSGEAKARLSVNTKNERRGKK